MKILIIEDDNRVAELITRGLKEQNFEVEWANTGKLGKSLALHNDYDLIIVDVLLPDTNGVELCKQIRTQRIDMPILLLTALGTTDDKVEGFEAGADDYLVKPFEMRELIARVKALISRKQRYSLSNKSITILQYADLEMNLITKTVRRNGKEITLTPKEFKLLQYMLENPERVLSREEIAQKVWNTYFDTGTNFIDVYINYLRKKIDKDFSHKLIHTKIGMGFILQKE
ncbi:MAG: response regulator transcription factor [Bacteroidia bacterium]|nr:response regulator transcription factor [Bacteroidia bacterium]MDW8157995.1 response regulator transcription factor [Bacteroidia bacterium]